MFAVWYQEYLLLHAVLYVSPLMVDVDASDVSSSLQLFTSYYGLPRNPCPDLRHEIGNRTCDIEFRENESESSENVCEEKTIQRENEREGVKGKARKWEKER